MGSGISNSPTVNPNPKTLEEKETKSLRKKRGKKKIYGKARSRSFRPCSYDKDKLKTLLDALVELYPEMERLNISDDGISFEFTLRPDDILKKLEDKKGEVNPSKR